MNDIHFFFPSSEPVGRRLERSHISTALLISPDWRMELLMQSQQLYIWYLKIAILSNLVAACSREAGTALSSS